MTPYDEKFIGNGVAMRLGPPRLRQIRVKPRRFMDPFEQLLLYQIYTVLYMYTNLSFLHFTVGVGLVQIFYNKLAM